MSELTGERVAKVIARAGLCSRREAEAWIAAGRVAVDGKLLDTPAFTVTDANAIAVDGKPIPATEPTRLWRYFKPIGLVTTNRDPQGRPTVFENLPNDMPRVVSVGRLDLKSEGLLLLTNDGELARRLELPSTGWVRRYRVNGKVDPQKLEALEKGIEVEGVRYGPIRARLDRQLPSNAWLTVSLTEGRNREVRRVCEHLGWRVMRLIRVSFGPFQLGQLKDGEAEEVKGRVLADQIGGPGAKGTGAAKAKEKKPYRGGKAAKRNAAKPNAPPPPQPSPAYGGRGGKKAAATRNSPSPAGGGGVGKGVDPRHKGGLKHNSTTPKGRPRASHRGRP